MRGFRVLSVQNFLGNEASLVSVLGIRIDKIWKEKELEHQEDDGKLDENDSPELGTMSVEEFAAIIKEESQY